MELCCDDVVSFEIHGGKEGRRKADDEQGKKSGNCTVGSKRPVTSS